MPRRSATNTVNDFHASLTHNHNDVGRPNGGLGVTRRVAGLRHRSGHARHRRAGAAVRRRREPRVQHVHDGRDDHRRQPDRRYAASGGQRLEGVGRAHVEGRRAVPVPAGPARAERDVQRHVHVCRHRDRLGLRRLPARRAEQLHPVVGRHLLSAQPVRRRVRAGQLARALEPDDQLRRCAGTSWRRGTSGTTRSRPSWPDQQSAVYPGAPLGLVFPGDTGIARGLSPTRFGNVSPRLGVAYSPNEKTSLRASYGLFYTAFQGLSAGIMYGVPPYGYNYLSPAPPLFDTPFITAADGTQQRPAVSAAVPAARRIAEQPGHQHRLVAVSARERRSVLRLDEQDAVLRQLHVLDSARAGAEHGRRPPATSARAATTCWCCSRRTRAIPRCASA